METGNFQVHRSNQTEHLVDALFDDLQTPLGSPFQKELLIVQGQGMATWLGMQLSRRAGVWANAEYLYPKRFTERIFELVLGTQPKLTSVRERYSPDSLLWTIAARLPSHFSDPAFEALRDYVGNPLDESRLFSLAGKIAETYDEYLTYRPELIRLWSKAEGLFAEPQLELFHKPLASDPAVWQRKLWRDIEAVLGADHPAALEKRCLQALARRKKFPGLPERISLFGLSTLPPMYVRLLAALSKHTTVRLYLPSPCREYFGDILLDTPLSRDAARDAPGPDGNRLLRVLGVQAAEFNQVITESCEAETVAEQEHTHYAEPETDTLLHQVQRNILTFSETSTVSSAANDASIVVHSCHSPTREVEVMHDQILELINEHGYRPDDILVLLPDVESYAPLIDAVFRRSDDRFLPYRIADRRMESESSVAKAFLRILDLASTRVTAAQVMDLLSLAPVHRHFDILPTDLATIAEWVAQANVTWGIDASHRRAELSDAGVTDSDLRNTWQAGLERLLMGYAIDTRGQELVLGVFPHEHIEGKAGLLLGKFCHFARTLFSHVERLQRPQTVVEWQDCLSAMVESLLDVGPDEHWQLQTVLDALAALREWSHQANYEQAVGIQVVRHLLNQRLEQQGSARGFLAGGLTLSALIPMRTVPFKVICLMGMNDGAFPREAFRTDFNLLEHGEEKRRLGDPNRQKDDRYLFLEALCSAREKFIVSYVGQSIRDNSVRTPSIVVVELLESLAAMQHTAVADHVVRHPLQPFSPRYFDGRTPKLSSYASEFVPREASDLPQANDETNLGFFPTALPTREARVLPLAELLKFFRSPTRYLLENRLGVQLRGDRVGLHEHDATALAPLDGYAVGSTLLERVRSGVGLDESRSLTFAQGALPRGQLGNYEHARMEETARSIAAIADTLLSNVSALHVSLRVRIRAFEIEGTIANVYASKRVHVQFSRLRGRGLLPHWVEHLLLAHHTRDPQLRTWLVGRDEEKNEPAVACFDPVAEPEHELSNLLEIFELGSRVPIPLFPDLSFAFSHNPKAGDYIWDKGWTELLNQEEVTKRVYGQHSHLLIDRPMVTVDGVDIPTFEQLSNRVFTPLVRHLSMPSWRDVVGAFENAEADT